MRTVILGARPPAVEALIELRHTTGADLYDEVWEGEYHMAPAPTGRHGRVDSEIAAALHPLAKRVGLFPTGPFNLGTANNYRVPDRGLRRDERDGAWIATAPLVVEIVSPGDESWEKLPFYSSHRVDEVLIADPATRELTWLRLDEGEYRPVDHSLLLGVDVADIAAPIDWPPTD